jgi:hypothetical protein
MLGTGNRTSAGKVTSICSEFSFSFLTLSLISVVAKSNADSMASLMELTNCPTKAALLEKAHQALSSMQSVHPASQVLYPDILNGIFTGCRVDCLQCLVFQTFKLFPHYSNP